MSKASSDREGVPSLTEHEVLFLDFLGFSSAVEQWADHWMERLILALAALSEAQSDFDIKGEAQQDGSYRITSRPKVTTFSDNIVASYPAAIHDPAVALSGFMSPYWGKIVRQQMQRITAEVVLIGVDLRLLVRGGLSKGKLYHQGSVVVGEAMIDAYHLERCVAKEARVAVSPRITDAEGIFVDVDGLRCLDFFNDLMRAAERTHGNALEWARATKDQIDVNIESLIQNGQHVQANKWQNFGKWLAGRVKNNWPGGQRLEL